MDFEPMSVEAVRQWFSDQFEMTADWRARKAREYPDDRRNLNAVEELTRLKQEAGSIDAATAEAYAAAPGTDDDLAVQLLEIEHEALRRIGFSRHPNSATEFVAEIVEEFLGSPAPFNPEI